MPKSKFPEYAAPTKINYVGGEARELHLRKCKFVVHQEDQIREFVFDQNSVTIGAMADNDLVINDETVSRYHAKVIQAPDGYLLLDQHSTNGTYINRVRIREAFLKPGCTIHFGTAEVKFYFADERVRILPSEKEELGLLVGRSVKLREIYGILEKVAPTGATVVIEGETGTGKEVVARTIHQLGSRPNGPMMIFDCGAVPENLIESELFGHEKGSFTGALMTRQGLFELAHGGTLFLDEIGELTLDLQPKLLRVLEQREVRRVGSNKSMSVDVRVLAATNRNLADEARTGRFREDLYYRLSVVRLVIPPLRDRREDIEPLALHFLHTMPFNRNGSGDQKVHGIEPEALALMTAYQWPGNVRELVNVMERACSFADHDSVRVADLPDSVRLAAGGPTSQETPVDATFKDAKERWVSTFERDYIVHLLKKNDGNISHAAREADIDRKYFRKLMRKHEVEIAGAGEGGDAGTELEA